MFISPLQLYAYASNVESADDHEMIDAFYRNFPYNDTHEPPTIKIGSYEACLLSIQRYENMRRSRLGMEPNLLG